MLPITGLLHLVQCWEPRFVGRRPTTRWFSAQVHAVEQLCTLAWGGRAAADAEILIWRGMGLQVTSGNRNAAHRFKWEDVEPGENRRGVEGRGAG